MEQVKEVVYNFWNNAACGENLYLTDSNKQAYVDHANKRYELEPLILDFSQFHLYQDKDVLEIGVGLGAEHLHFAKAGAKLKGIDLTERAVWHTRERLRLFGLASDLKVADAENLPYADNSFDLVFSWGVLHHTPDTPKAISEVWRVLKKGGEAKIMIYHKYSLVGYMLWIRYALLKLKPFTSLSSIYRRYLESPGTKAYSIPEAKKLFKAFSRLEIKTALGHADLLTSSAGQRHRGLWLAVAKVIWPRWFLKQYFNTHGLLMLIVAKK